MMSLTKLGDQTKRLERKLNSQMMLSMELLNMVMDSGQDSYGMDQIN